METIKRPKKKTHKKKIICKNLCLRFRLTKVQHRGQNHHIMSRASSRKTTSNEMSTMVPSNCENRKHNGGVSGHARLKAEDEETTKKKGRKTKAEVLTASSDGQTQQRRPRRGRTEEVEEEEDYGTKRK